MRTNQLRGQHMNINSGHVKNDSHATKTRSGSVVPGINENILRRNSIADPLALNFVGNGRCNGDGKRQASKVKTQ